ncbi:hypothetical protein A0H81_04741 [Grifola frondosa]|uniref:Uncharacterized protein n=1 Tax=Grifola frondosa TaxID=5627 RepID=A0A1C7MFB0_GRIFR|nr:hypothetical protein A0H81_04741 [Grifola frondosa]
MPAFDPVRDAVLNSPISRPTPLPTNARPHIDLALPTAIPPNMVPYAAEHTSSPALVSPLTRRATDLSVLLNSEPPPSDTPLFTPTTPRAPAHSPTSCSPTPSTMSPTATNSPTSLPSAGGLLRAWNPLPGEIAGAHHTFPTPAAPALAPIP